MEKHRSSKEGGGDWMNHFKWHAEKAAVWGEHPRQPGYYTRSPPLSSCFFGEQPHCVKSQTSSQNTRLVRAEEVGRVHLVNKYVCVFESHQLLQTVCAHGYICITSPCLRSQSFVQSAAAGGVGRRHPIGSPGAWCDSELTPVRCLPSATPSCKALSLYAGSP